MVKISNSAQGARGVRTKGGELVMIDPGQSVDVELADGEELYEGLARGAPKAAEDDEGDAKREAPKQK